MTTDQSAATTACPSCGARATGKFCNACGTPLTTMACANCQAPLPAGARFCSECGGPVAAAGRAAPTGGRRASGSTASTGGGANYLPWALATIALLAVIGWFASQNSTEAPLVGNAAPMAAGGAPFAAGGGGGAPPDISQMSPRERASRLYDRIMRYVEQGKKDSAQFFAPMALASFEALETPLDVDARYDYGRVASETGNFDVAKAQADAILKESPNHLLGLSLSARTAILQGDTAGAAKLWKQFLAAKDAELQKKLPEYEMHASDIQQSTQLAQGGK